MTLRSEYVDALVEGLDLAVAAAYTVRPLGRAALRQVVEEPAQIAGITVSEELMARLVDDTGDGDALPLLAFTLAELALGIHNGAAERRDDGAVHIGVAYEQFLAAWEPLRAAIERVRPKLAARDQLDVAAWRWAEGAVPNARWWATSSPPGWRTSGRRSPPGVGTPVRRV